jgi:hypothetical protein
LKITYKIDRIFGQQKFLTEFFDMVNFKRLKLKTEASQNIFQIELLNNVKGCFFSFYKRPIFVAVEKKTCQIITLQIF